MEIPFDTLMTAFEKQVCRIRLPASPAAHAVSCSFLASGSNSPSGASSIPRQVAGFKKDDMIMNHQHPILV
jgi:hypothetical protein